MIVTNPGGATLDDIQETLEEMTEEMGKIFESQTAPVINVSVPKAPPPVVHISPDPRPRKWVLTVTERDAQGAIRSVIMEAVN